MKRCIFHVPYPIEKEGYAGSAIRPRQMLEAFRQNFDEVFVISGYGAERKRRFRQLKYEVSRGKKYAFMYSENSTMPNLLTERDHMPRYPFLEKSIFRFCKKNHIPVGLFYRDIDWKFSHYRKTVSFYKRCITIPLYWYDLIVYNKYIDILYLPSLEMGKYVPYKGKIKRLPPGINKKNIIVYEKNMNENRKMKLFYVGGVGGRYDLTKLIEGMRQCDFAELTICCYEEQWNEWLKSTGIKMPSNIKVVQGHGKELEKHYREADIGVLFINTNGYIKMAMPIKLFEYMQYQLPVIATGNCTMGDFVEENEIGWTIPYQVQEFVRILSYLKQNHEDYRYKCQKISEAIEKHTWSARALSVSYDLNNIEEK